MTPPLEAVRRLMLLIVTLGLVVPAGVFASPDGSCEKGRQLAAAKYLGCQHKALASFAVAQNAAKYQAAVAKCVNKYAAAWPRLQAKTAGSGALCDGPRFVDAGTGNVVDNLTALIWEKKTDDGMLHDQDDVYTWSAAMGQVANGTAFTSFLPALNAACLSGRCDWRLPTSAELQSILSQGYPCASPCLPTIFGPTIAGPYWTANEVVTNFDTTFYVDFSDGRVDGTFATTSYSLRAVRGGL